MSNEVASLILFTGTALALVFSWLAWRRRPAMGSRILTILLLLGALWALGNALMLRAFTLEGKLFWLNVQMIAINLLGPTWFTFAANYVPRNGWMSRRVAVGAYLPALLLILLVWTNSWHGWVWQTPRLSMLQGQPYLAYEWGIGRLSMLLYGYGVVLAGIILFVQKFGRSLYLYRRVSRYFISGCVLALALDALTMASPRLVPNFDASPLVFISIGAFLVMTTVHRDVWDVMPFSGREILRNMRDGVLVLDKRNRIMGCNHAASELLGREREALYGADPQGLVGWSTFEMSDDPNQEQLFDLQWTRISQRGEEEETLDLEARVSPLHDGNQRLQGRLLVLRDQTQQRRAERELWQSEANLRSVQRMESVGHLAGEVARDFGSLLDGVNQQLTGALDHLSTNTQRPTTFARRCTIRTERWSWSTSCWPMRPQPGQRGICRY